MYVEIFMENICSGESMKIYLLFEYVVYYDNGLKFRIY